MTMSKFKEKKPVYSGWKQAGDDKETRAKRALQEAELRVARANARGAETNAVFAASDGAFRTACEAVGCQPTAAQASKWRRQTGIAWLATHGEEDRLYTSKDGKPGLRPS